MKDLKMWKFIFESLKKNGSVLLTVVLESKGSSPGKAGFKLAVSEEGVSVGTIGGGQMEYDLLKDCERILKSKKKALLHRDLYHSKKVKKLQSGLVCQGRQTNFTITLDKKDLSRIKKIIQLFYKNEEAVLALTPEGLNVKPGLRNSKHIVYRFKSGNDWSYEENIGVKDTMYIIGGGHVGLALSNQMELLGFHIIVFDDRSDLNTLKENHSADEIIITSYDNIGGYVEEGDYSYVAIVTSALPTDKIALRQILGRKVRYIGMLGSEAKIKRIFSELKEEGISPSLFKKVRAPIGLPINSNTVEEIAVSIASQIIKIKNR
ncbi:MAG TPA: XdhC family protein [Melioribacteraceae bacterium]|nr:XdhC family protein [Melioribacteraceae bacterium]